MGFQNPTKKYASLEQVNSNGILKVEVVNQPSPIDYTALLTSIDTKLDDIALIKQELIDANGTLTSIEGDTSAIETNTGDILTQVTTTNTKLEDVKTKLDAQTVLLTDLKTELVAANASLDAIEVDTAAIKASLLNVEADVATIKADIATIKTDVAAIKASVATIEADTEDIKVAVQSIDTKLDTVNSNLDSIETKLDTIHSDLTTINGTLQAEFDETQVALANLQTAIEFAQDTFQTEDCDGNPIGVEENVIKTVVLNKTTAAICNTAEISDPIVTAIQAQSAASATGKKQDFISWAASANDTMTIPANKFTTIAMLATKGEFKIENSTNDFSGDVTTSAGTISNFIEISEDGVGTATGSTSVAQGFDTRANSADMDLANNSFLVTCVRAGVLSAEFYK